MNKFFAKAIIVMAVVALSLPTTFGQNNDPDNLSVDAVNPYVCFHLMAKIPSNDKQGEITATITWCHDGVPISTWMGNPTVTLPPIPGFTGWNEFASSCCAYKGIPNEIHYVVKVTNIFTNKVILKDCGVVYFSTFDTDVYWNIETWNGCFGEPLEITPESPY